MKFRRFVLTSLILFLSGCNQGGSSGCHGQLPGVTEHDPRKINEPDCVGDACADITIKFLGMEQGHEIKNNGKNKVTISVKWASGVQCQDFSDVTLGPKQSQEFCSDSYCMPYKANIADPSASTIPIPKTPKIINFTINRNTSATVTATTPVELMITLDKPALSGGTKIGFSHITDTGLTDAIKQRPESMTIDQGKTVGTMQLQTQRVDPSVTTTHIVFTAVNDCNKRSAELRINQ